MQTKQNTSTKKGTKLLTIAKISLIAICWQFRVNYKNTKCERKIKTSGIRIFEIESEKVWYM